MLKRKQHSQLVVLIDPDKYNPDLIDIANEGKVSYFFVGGSQLISGSLDKTIKDIKKRSDIPVVIFPGDETQVSKYADGILLLSLISGRNPDYLIEMHVNAASKLKKSGLSILSTGYLLIEGGNVSTTQKVTKTKPLSLKNKKRIVDTAIAGELLGMKLIYLEAGSGARNSIPKEVISSVKKHITVPLIVGGGIDSVEKAQKVMKSGADYIVVGNALEKQPELLKKLSKIF